MTNRRKYVNMVQVTQTREFETSSMQNISLPCKKKLFKNNFSDEYMPDASRAYFHQARRN